MVRIIYLMFYRSFAAAGLACSVFLECGLDDWLGRFAPDILACR